MTSNKPKSTSKATEAEETTVTCRPWCTWQDGHPSVVEEDQFCAGTDSMAVLSQGNLGQTAGEYVVTYPVHWHDGSSSGIHLGRGEAAGVILTDAEALQLAEQLTASVRIRRESEMQRLRNLIEDARYGHANSDDLHEALTATEVTYGLNVTEAAS